MNFLMCSQCVQNIFNTFNYLPNMFLMCTHSRNIPKKQCVQYVPPYTIGGTLDILNKLGIVKSVKAVKSGLIDLIKIRRLRSEGEKGQNQIPNLVTEWPE